MRATASLGEALGGWYWMSFTCVTVVSSPLNTLLLLCVSHLWHIPHRWNRIKVMNKVQFFIHLIALLPMCNIVVFSYRLMPPVPLHITVPVEATRKGSVPCRPTDSRCERRGHRTHILQPSSSQLSHGPLQPSSSRQALPLHLFPHSWAQLTG